MKSFNKNFICFLNELARQAALAKSRNINDSAGFNAFFFPKELATKKIHERKIRALARAFSDVQIRRFFKKAREENLIKNGKKGRGRGRQVELVLSSVWHKILTDSKNIPIRQCLFEEREFASWHGWEFRQSENLPMPVFNYVLGVLKERDIDIPSGIEAGRLYSFFFKTWKNWQNLMLEKSILGTIPMTFYFEMCFCNFAISKLKKTKAKTLFAMKKTKMHEDSFESLHVVSVLENSMPKGWLDFAKKVYPDKKEGAIIDNFFRFKTKFLSGDGAGSFASCWKDVFVAFIDVGDVAKEAMEIIEKKISQDLFNAYQRKRGLPETSAYKAKDILEDIAVSPFEKDIANRFDTKKATKLLSFKSFLDKNGKLKEEKHMVCKEEMYKRTNEDARPTTRKKREIENTSHLEDICVWFGRKEHIDELRVCDMTRAEVMRGMESFLDPGGGEMFWEKGEMERKENRIC